MKDTIYRDDAIKCCRNEWEEEVEERLRLLPSAERTGEWKRRIVDYGWNADWVCSECGHRVYYDFVNFNYCPNCGARMVAKMTVTETQMHHFICAWCDNPKCVRGTDKCEFEQWKKKKEGERKNECID